MKDDYHPHPAVYLIMTTVTDGALAQDLALGLMRRLEGDEYLWANGTFIDAMCGYIPERAF